jgi:hypothetical protein
MSLGTHPQPVSRDDVDVGCYSDLADNQTLSKLSR